MACIGMLLLVDIKWVFVLVDIQFAGFVVAVVVFNSGIRVDVGVNVVVVIIFNFDIVVVDLIGVGAMLVEI